jgi:hypothetical protein
MENARFMELFHLLAIALRVYYSKVSPAKMHFLQSKIQAEWVEGLLHDILKIAYSSL